MTLKQKPIRQHTPRILYIDSPEDDRVVTQKKEEIEEEIFNEYSNNKTHNFLQAQRINKILAKRGKKKARKPPLRYRFKAYA